MNPFLPSVALLVALGACSDGSAQRVTQDEVAPRSTNAAAAQKGAMPDFATLVEEQGKAVVNVEVLQRPQHANRQSRVSPEDPLFDFFRRFGIPPPQFGQRGEAPPARGSGSGFIVSNDGYILTNAHVVAEADEVTVRLTDRREFRAKVIGFDERTDTAVIKIDGKDLPTVRLGTSKNLKPGEWVVAIGSPFGLENSVTAGIVSATSRAVGEGSYVPFIQTDVAVNPGNSGGPLFNLRGEVVGINSMIFSASGGYMGLSFAIPIDVATDVRDQIVKTGRVVRSRIGVGVQDVNAQLAESFGLDRPRGALVSMVEESGPAAKAGLKPGDVILEVNGHTIDRYGELSSEIATMSPGSEAKLRIWRNGKEDTVTVRVVQLEEKTMTRASKESDSQSGSLGLTVRPLTAEEKQSAGTAGVVVEQVEGPAATAGVQPGDLIIGANGKPIESPAQLREAVKSAKRIVALLVQRGEAQIFVPVTIG
jgi:serine protease Do